MRTKYIIRDLMDNHYLLKSDKNRESYSWIDSPNLCTHFKTKTKAKIVLLHLINKYNGPFEIHTVYSKK